MSKYDKGIASKKVELHPDFAKWYREIKGHWEKEDVYKSFAIKSIAQIGFGSPLKNCYDENDENLFELNREMKTEKEKYIRAILDDNWVVREEKKYWVVLPEVKHEKYLNRNIETESIFFEDSYRDELYQTQFTEKEIKSIDERYWEFREEVE